MIDKVAWIRVQNGRVLSTRSKGKTAWYFPGGKREAGESDAQTLLREVKEELDVELRPGTVAPYGVFEAQADGKADGVVVRMTCYTADYDGELTPSAEIDELDWIGWADRGRVSPVDVLILERLRDQKLLSS
ncbi:DNA mismatch repair protein MutT [Mangrovactinospora gilvigrisea]|uniref:DNA mismatch repair protein MutT n=1 Tax=Mangrovactinospora gilvigrisea TaxID=1428644 RepID=A0A1J7CH97_9ACTN|nr:DNA mismatch repair protein MutT [Mangrovactinospora gilvigrisea]